MDQLPMASVVPDTSFTIGARVLVGGLKPGRLRYIGSVHFVPDSEGLWCGVELDDADGLHDGTVDGVRYFTCRNGHGVLAPRHRVAVHYQTPVTGSARNPWAPLVDDAVVGPAASVHLQQRSTSGIPPPSVQLRRKNVTRASSSALTSGDVTIGRPSVSSDMLTGRNGIGFNGKQIRPLSASMIVTVDDSQHHQQQQQQQQLTFMNVGCVVAPKRSSLTDKRPLSAFVEASANNIRSSPKRVTFFDEVCNPRDDNAAVRGRASQTSERRTFQNVHNAGRRSGTDDRGGKVKTTMTECGESDCRLTARRSRSADGRELTELLSGDSRRLTVTHETESQRVTRTSGSSSAVVVGDEYNNTLLRPSSSSGSRTNRRPNSSDTEQLIDSAIADVPTPPETEMQISVDSIDSNDWSLSQLDKTCTLSNREIVGKAQSTGSADRKLSLDSSRAELYGNTKVDDWMTSHQSSDYRVTDAELRKNELCRNELMGSYPFKVSSSCGTSPARGGAELGAQSKAGLELARTALAQYADLVRAARQCRRGFMTIPPSSNHDDANGEDGWDRLFGMTMSMINTKSSSCDEPFSSQQSASATKQNTRSPVEATWDSWPSSTGSSSAGGAGDDMEFETFDGEELLLDAAMIDSIDGGSVHSEDSMAMVPHLSDEEDGNEHVAVSVDARPETHFDYDDYRLRVSVYEDDSLNVSMDLGGAGWLASDLPLVDGNGDSIMSTVLDDEGNVTMRTPSNATMATTEHISDVGWLNDMNNVISRQLRQPWTLMVSADVESGCRSENQLYAVSGGGDDEYSTDDRTERPMSMVSNTSSIDTGCHVDCESDMTASSYSAGMYSSVYTDDMSRSWCGDHHQTQSTCVAMTMTAGDNGTTGATDAGDDNPCPMSYAMNSDVRVSVANEEMLHGSPDETLLEDVPVHLQPPVGGTAVYSSTADTTVELTPTHTEKTAHEELDCDHELFGAMPVAAAADCRPRDAEVEKLIRVGDSGSRDVTTESFDEYETSTPNVRPDSAKEVDGSRGQSRDVLSRSACDTSETVNGKINGAEVSTLSIRDSSISFGSVASGHLTGLLQKTLMDTDEQFSAVENIISTVQPEDADTKRLTNTHIDEQLNFYLIKKTVVIADQTKLTQSVESHCFDAAREVADEKMLRISSCLTTAKGPEATIDSERMVGEVNLPSKFDGNLVVSPCPASSEQNDGWLTASTVVERHQDDSDATPVASSSTTPVKSTSKSTDTHKVEREFTQETVTDATETKKTLLTSARRKDVTSSVVSSVGRSMSVGGQRRSTDTANEKVANTKTIASRVTSTTRRSSDQKPEQQKQQDQQLNPLQRDSTLRSRTRVPSAKDTDSSPRRTSVRSATTSNVADNSKKPNRGSVGSMTASPSLSKNTGNTANTARSKAHVNTRDFVNQKETSMGSTPSGRTVTGKTNNQKTNKSGSANGDPKSVVVDGNDVVPVPESSPGESIPVPVRQDEARIIQATESNLTMIGEPSEDFTDNSKDGSQTFNAELTVTMASDVNVNVTDGEVAESKYAKNENDKHEIPAAKNYTVEKCTSASVTSIVSHSTSSTGNRGPNSGSKSESIGNPSTPSSRMKTMRTNPVNRNPPARGLTTESKTSTPSSTSVKERSTTMTGKQPLPERRTTSKSDIIYGSVSNQKPYTLSKPMTPGHEKSDAEQRETKRSRDFANVPLKGKPVSTTPSTETSRRKDTSAAVKSTVGADKTSRPPAKPSLSDQLADNVARLKTALEQIEILTREKDEMLKAMNSLKEEHVQLVEMLETRHRMELRKLDEQHRSSLETELNKVVDQHSHEVNTLKAYNERRLREANTEKINELALNNTQHRAIVDKMAADHEAVVLATKIEHDRQIQEITDRFEDIKQSLSDKVDQLRIKCDEMLSREQSYLSAGKKEYDVRRQMSLEVDSMRVVVEQKNEEIHKLRQSLAEHEIKLEEVPVLKATISKCKQQMENLEAIVCLKNDHERQLAEMQQQLLKRCERESKAVKRLSMNNEELMWRLSRSDIGPIPDDEMGFPPQSPVTGSAPKAMSLMSRSCEGPRTMFSSSPPHSGRVRTSSTTSVAAGSASLRGPKTMAEGLSESVRLRRSGTYEVVDEKVEIESNPCDDK